MGLIKRALRRTSRKLLSKIIPPAHSHQLVLNPRAHAMGDEACAYGQAQAGKRKLAAGLQRRFSKKSSGKDTAVAEALLLAVKNHLPPLQFHHVHGPNAQLSANRCVARRTQSFCQALVFSNRVILPNERVYIKVLEIAKFWNGTIRFGFTAVDPATLARRMPKHACPDMTNAGHTWARALADEVVRRNSVIHFSYTKTGIIHYGINNQDCGVFHANVATNQNLWFIVDIYGLTAAVELIDPRVNSASASAASQFVLTGSQQGHEAQQRLPPPSQLGVERSCGQTTTMFKSTSAMDELFGDQSHRFGWPAGAASRRKKMSRKHARHAAMIQRAATAAGYWPIDGPFPEANTPLHLWPHHQHQAGANQAAALPNLNSVSLPSAQQNIYSPMPSEQQQQRRPMGVAGTKQQHDYHQIITDAAYSSALPAYQPLRSVSMANIAAGSSAMVASAPGPSRGHDETGAEAISQADLSHQLENMHLYERRMRKLQQAKLAAANNSAAQASTNQTPVAASRKRQHLRPINTNQTPPATRAPTAGLDEASARSDQPDKRAASSSTGGQQRIIPGKIIATSAAATSSSSSMNNARTKTRHSIKTPKATTTTMGARDSRGAGEQAPSKDCPICFERPINCVLYQCGHMCTCYECGVKQWRTQSRSCPICRTTIKDVIKTYMS